MKRQFYFVGLFALGLVTATTACLDGVVGGECRPGFVEVDGVCVSMNEAALMTACPDPDPDGGVSRTASPAAVAPPAR